MSRPHNGSGLSAQLAILTGRGEGHGWLELRYRHGAGMRTRFYPVDGNHRALRALITRHAAHTDVYIGCALRDHQRGDKTAVGEAWAIWAECDTPAAAAAAEAFDPPPTLIVASGTAGHAHTYWGLRSPIAPDQLENANRRLAAALGADSACWDRGRILRPCGSWSHKHQPPVAVVATAGSSALYSLAEITTDLPELVPAAVAVDTPRAVDDDPLLAISPRIYVPVLTRQSLGLGSKVRCPRHDLSVGEAAADGVSPARSVNDASSNDRRVLSDPLLLVPPPVYFERLTGRRVGRSGKLHCLFHDDREPSLHVYREPDRGWFCFGCRRGGSVYDLAALLFGLKTRGADFIELRRELEQRLL